MFIVTTDDTDAPISVPPEWKRQDSHGQLDNSEILWSDSPPMEQFGLINDMINRLTVLLSHETTTQTNN